MMILSLVMRLPQTVSYLLIRFGIMPTLSGHKPKVMVSLTIPSRLMANWMILRWYTYSYNHNVTMIYNMAVAE